MFQDLVFAVIRIVFGSLFACHGAEKLFGLWGMHSMIHDPLMLVAGILEFGGGILVAMGLLTRPVAIVLCGEMAVAYFNAHFPWASADREQGRVGGALLLFLPVPVGARRRRAERGRHAEEALNAVGWQSSANLTANNGSNEC